MRIALAGRAYSGKTSLARALQQRHGYAWWSYTDYLKQLLATALTAMGVPTEVDDMLADKPRYRPALVALSALINFDGASWVERYIQTESPLGNPALLPNDLVWDNCRFPGQYEALRAYGFVLVTLDLSDAEQATRSGLDATGLEQLRHEVTEQRFSHVPYGLHCDAALPTDILADGLAQMGRQPVFAPKVVARYASLALVSDGS